MENVGIVYYLILALSLILFLGSIWFRRKTQKEFKEKNDLIKMRETEFNELRLLAAGVTHEINNAITIILGRTAQIQKKNEDAGIEDLLKNIQKTSNRVVDSVKGLRQFIYPDNQEIEEFIELTALMENVFKLAGQRLRNHGIDMKLTGLEHKVVKVRKTQFEQLIINLLNQSIERLASIQDKWIQIVAAYEEGHLHVYYMDASGQVGDRVSLRQFTEILEKNHGHLTVNQNNLVLELPKSDEGRYHF